MKCGGQGVYLWFLSRALAKLGIELDVFVGPPYPDPMPFARAVHELPNRQFWAQWFTRDWNAMFPHRDLRALSPLHFYELAASRIGFLPEPFAFSLRAFREMTREMRGGTRWDLVHDVQCLGYGMLGLQSLGLPVVTTIHHPLTVDRRTSFVRDTTLRDAIGTMCFYPIGMQSFVARRLDRVITSSEASAMQIVRDFGVSTDRVVNVWNGLDTDLYSPDADLEKSPQELLCVGRANDPNKGVKTLIRALAQLGGEAHLTLVDDDHPHNPVYTWARQAGVAERLHVTGRLETAELVRLYRRATLTVVPSLYEGFGLPAVESMACGTPVVATDAGALPEVLRLTGGGLLVPRDDPGALAKGIGTMLEQAPTRAMLATRGRRGVVSSLSWARVAETTAEVYAEVLAERRGRPASTMTSANDGTARATRSPI
jgi:glycosyltransferase involved in cell wall biosynthesis